MSHSRKGRPATGASGFGTSRSTWRMRVPSPPARMTATGAPMSRGSDVAVAAVAQDRVALDQLADAAVEPPLGAEARACEPRVRHDVVALVRVLADRRLDVHEARHVLLDRLAQLDLGEVGLVEADVVGPAAHLLEVLEGVEEDARNVLDVDV